MSRRWALWGVLLGIASATSGCVAGVLAVPGAVYIAKEYGEKQERVLTCACSREVAVQYAVRAARAAGFAPGAVPVNAASFEAAKLGGIGDKLTVDIEARSPQETRIMASVLALLGRSKTVADEFVIAIKKLAPEAITEVPKPP